MSNRNRTSPDNNLIELTRTASAALVVAVMALLVACNGAGAAATPDAAARNHTEPPPSIATAIAQAESAVSDALSDAGSAYKPCGRMCTESFWLTATPADVQAELDRGAAADAISDFVGIGGIEIAPLHYAAAFGKWPAVEVLLDAGAEINAVAGIDPVNYIVEDSTPLASAILTSNLDAIALLLERGADPNAQSGHRKGTPLHMTADPVIAALLIANGADVNAQNERGETPLDTAYGVQIFTLLLASGADTTHSSWVWPPLHRAVSEFQDAGLVKMLLERGAYVNATTADGETACDRVKAAIRDRQPSDSPSDLDEIRGLVCP